MCPPALALSPSRSPDTPDVSLLEQGPPGCVCRTWALDRERWVGAVVRVGAQGTVHPIEPQSAPIQRVSRTSEPSSPVMPKLPAHPRRKATCPPD